MPGVSDDVTIDGHASGLNGGTITVNTNISILSLTISAMVGTLDFATNDNNITLSAASAFTNTGSGTRTLNMGDGVWTLSGVNGTFTQNGATNLTFNANSSTISFTGNGARRFFPGSSRTYNIVIVSGGSNASLAFQATLTSSVITTLTIAAQNRVSFVAGATLTITNLTNISASVSTPVLLVNDNPVNGVSTISSANNFTGDYCGFQGLTFSGGGTFAGTNSYNFGQNSGITITAPSVGGGVVGVIGG